MKKTNTLIALVIGTLSALSFSAYAGDNCAPPQDCSKPYKTDRDLKNDAADQRRAEAAAQRTKEQTGEKPTPSKAVYDGPSKSIQK